MIEINENESYNVLLLRSLILHKKYEEISSTFSYLEKKQKIAFQRGVKNQVYALKLLEWQKDVIWERICGSFNYGQCDTTND